MTNHKRDKSPKVAQRDKIGYDLNIFEFPWSPKQLELINLIQDKKTKVVFVKGPAGSSKTLVGTYCGLKSINEKKTGEMLFVRAPVESSRFTLGFLKGDLSEKMAPFLLPLSDQLSQLLAPSDILKLEREERIQGLVVGHLRGRTFNVNYILVDESQDLERKDLLLILTRLGKYSKMIICGDVSQPDIKNSAFEGVVELFNNEESRERGIYTFEFGKEDIFRNEILSFIIEKFENFK